MNKQYSKELTRIVGLMCTSTDDAWTDAALVFVTAAVEDEKVGFITLCQNLDGSAQSWRNMGYRPNDLGHELALPSDYVEAKEPVVEIIEGEEGV